MRSQRSYSIMTKNKTFIKLLIILITAIVIFAVLMNSNGDRAKISQKKAIDFTLTDQYGTKHKLSEYEGKVVFVNFWATWCPPCRNELPAFQKAYEKHGRNKDDVIILGIYAPGFDKEGTSEEVISYFKDQELDYPILADEGGRLFAKYAVSALPTTVMIDRNGNEATRNTGEMTANELSEMIQRVSER
jgi:cytochrome c-type biogenesis protein